MPDTPVRDITVVGYPSHEADDYLKAIFEGTFANPNQHFQDRATLGPFSLPATGKPRRRGKEKESAGPRQDPFLEFALDGESNRLSAVALEGINSTEIYDPDGFGRRLSEASGAIFVVNPFFVWPAIAHKGFFGTIAYAQRKLRFDIQASMNLATRTLWDMNPDDPTFAEARLDEVAALIAHAGTTLRYSLDEPEAPVSIDGLDPVDAARLYDALAKMPSLVVRRSSPAFAAIRQVVSGQHRPMVVLSHSKVRTYCRDILDSDIEAALDHVFGPESRDRLVSQQLATELVDYEFRSHPKSPTINNRPSAEGGRVAWDRLKLWVKGRPKADRHRTRAATAPRASDAAPGTFVGKGRAVRDALAAASRRAARWQIAALAVGFAAVLIVTSRLYGLAAAAPWVLAAGLFVAMIATASRLRAARANWIAMEAQVRSAAATAPAPAGTVTVEPALTLLKARGARGPAVTADPVVPPNVAREHGLNGVPK